MGFFFGRPRARSVRFEVQSMGESTGGSTSPIRLTGTDCPRRIDQRAQRVAVVSSASLTRESVGAERANGFTDNRRGKTSLG